ncbi:MAG TPA: hypothetical protein VHE83_14305 [Mycobacteriales bacterium]|nr:hypothetical protein [Mycobacteriales bacterium]
MDLPGARSGLLVAWGSAWLAGNVSLDAAAAAISEADDEHETADGAGVESLLGGLRADGVTRLELLLPVAGDVRGLPEPGGAFARAALEAGEAVLPRGAARRRGLVPAQRRVGPEGDQLVITTWSAYPIATSELLDPPPLTASEADGELTEVLAASTRVLQSLSVARYHEGLDAPLAAMRERTRRGQEPASALPPGYPPRAVALLARADRLQTVLTLALADEGGARTSSEAENRAATLRQLATAVRRARLAAYNAYPQPRPA